MTMIEYTTLRDLISTIEITFDPKIKTNTHDADDLTTVQYYEFEKIIKECNQEDNEEPDSSPWIIYMVLNPEIMLEKNITMEDINYTLKNCYEDTITCIYNDFNSDKLVFRIRLNNTKKYSKNKLNSLDQTDEIHILKNFQESLMNNIIIRGVKILKSYDLYKQDIWCNGQLANNREIVNYNNLDILSNISLSDSKKTLFLMIGPQASGKTTIAYYLSNKFNLGIINADIQKTNSTMKKAFERPAASPQ